MNAAWRMCSAIVCIFCLVYVQKCIRKAKKPIEPSWSSAWNAISNATPSCLFGVWSICAAAAVACVRNPLRSATLVGHLPLFVFALLILATPMHVNFTMPKRYTRDSVYQPYGQLLMTTEFSITFSSAKSNDLHKIFYNRRYISIFTQSFFVQIKCVLFEGDIQPWIVGSTSYYDACMLSLFKAGRKREKRTRSSQSLWDLRSS